MSLIAPIIYESTSSSINVLNINNISVTVEVQQLSNNGIWVPYGSSSCTSSVGAGSTCQISSLAVYSAALRVRCSGGGLTSPWNTESQLNPLNLKSPTIFSSTSSSVTVLNQNTIGVTLEVQQLSNNGIWVPYGSSSCTLSVGAGSTCQISSLAVYTNQLRIRAATQGSVSDWYDSSQPPPSSSPTPTPTPTITPTLSISATNTPTITNTSSNTPTITPTKTVTPTPGASQTPTPTRTPTPGASQTPTPTVTPTPTRSSNIVVSPTPTSTPNIGQSPPIPIFPSGIIYHLSCICSDNSIPEQTNTPNSTPTRTPTSTSVLEITPTRTTTPTPTATPTIAPTTIPTSTPAMTPTSTPTATITSTPTITPTLTPTSSVTSTITPTPTITQSPFYNNQPFSFILNFENNLIDSGSHNLSVNSSPEEVIPEFDSTTFYEGEYSLSMSNPPTFSVTNFPSFILDTSNPFTIEFYYNTLTNNDLSFNMNQSINGYTWFLEIQNNDSLWFEHIDPNQGYTNALLAQGMPIGDGQWHHVILTRDNTGWLRLYLDNTLIAEHYDLLIPMHPNFNTPTTLTFSGGSVLIDNFKIFNTAFAPTPTPTSIV